MENQQPTEEKKLKSLAELSPEEQRQFYNNLYVLHFDKFCTVIDKLSSNALRRLLKMIVQYPLESKSLKTKSENEETAYLHACQAFNSKYAIMFERDMLDLGKILEHQKNQAQEKGENNEPMENK